MIARSDDIRILNIQEKKERKKIGEKDSCCGLVVKSLNLFSNNLSYNGICVEFQGQEI